MCIQKGDLCYAGTIQAKGCVIKERAITSCCATNNCNSGEASKDTNKLWCNFGTNIGQKGFPIYAQSCPAKGSCAVGNIKKKI